MKFLRKNIKLIIGIIVGMLLVSAISVYATYTYFATDISYTKGETEMNVAEALNDLYKNKKETSDIEKEITTNGKQTLDKYYKNLNINVQNSADETTNGTQLFYSEYGSYGSNITLSDSYKNYKKLQIFYSTNAHSSYETGYQSVVVNVSDLANQRNFIILSGVGFDATSVYYLAAGYYFSTQENILRFQAYMRRNMTNGDMYYGNDQLRVTKVIGIN